MSVTAQLLVVYTCTCVYSGSVVAGQPVHEIEGHQLTLAERRLLRSAYSLNSVDAPDDVFYDAIPTSVNSTAAYHKQL